MRLVNAVNNRSARRNRLAGTATDRRGMAEGLTRRHTFTVRTFIIKWAQK